MSEVEGAGADGEDTADEHAPSPEVAEAMRRAEGSLVRTIAAAMEGYADRPALGSRVRDGVLLARFETLSYSEVWRRVRALAAAWTGRVGPGDFVAVLGFNSLDYAIIDLACMYTGAVAVPLPVGWSAQRLAPIVAETRPRLLATDPGQLDAAVAAALASDSIERLLVFDGDPVAVAIQAAAVRLRGSADVVTLAGELARGTDLPAVEPYDDGDPDRLVSLIYTSGSTGAPKGAMYTASMVERMWQTGRVGMISAAPPGGTPPPTIVLHYMPMSHVNGRAWLVSGLSSGGIGYYTASADMSSLLDDIRMARPTVLSLVPRICDMVYQRYLLEAGRRPEAEALDEVRNGMLGGRIVSALCGSAPLSAAMHEFMAELLGTRVVDCYGSTETTRAVVVDQRVRRPLVTDYRLVDVPELGYFSTDKPYPRGELRVKSVGQVPGYFNRPDVEMRDEDGFYKTGDVFAELEPDRLVYVDRVGNVVKLSQGEFVAVSRLEALYATSPLVSQVYVYASGEQAFVLAVVVPADGAGRADILDSLREVAQGSGLAAYEVPYDVLIETEPFTIENGLLSGVGKPLRPALKERYGARLEQRYADIADGRAGQIAALRARGCGDSDPLEAVLAAVQVTLGYPAALVRADAGFVELGGDSLAAHTFATVLEQIFEVQVAVGVILGPTASLAGVAEYIRSARTATGARGGFDEIHGRGAVEVRARDLTLDRFVEEAGPGARSGAENVLLTGATGYLGRFLAVEVLERVAAAGGQLTCLVRAEDDATARNRLPAYLLDNAAAEKHLQVIAADAAAPRLGLSNGVWNRLAEESDRIVHAAALVNHVLPYRQLFAPNVGSTAALIELALERRQKHFAFVSTIAAAMQPDRTVLDEAVDVRAAAPKRSVDGSDANGYAVSKWAAEVLLRDTHERTGLPVTVFRPDMILAHTALPGQLNVTDRFSRLLLSVVASELAPRSFYRIDEEGKRQRAHYSGLPVDFTAAAIASLSARIGGGYITYNTVNAKDDGISLDVFVDWLIEDGHSIARCEDYAEWRMRCEAALRGLPERQQRHSLLPLMATAYARPAEPRTGTAMIPNERFRAAMGGAVPSLDAKFIRKSVGDLELLGLLSRRNG